MKSLPLELEQQPSELINSRRRRQRIVIAILALALICSEYLYPTHSHWVSLIGVLLLIQLLTSIGKLDGIARMVLLTSLIYYLYWLYFFPNSKYTNDLGAHLAYLNAVTEKWTDAFFYHRQEGWHPPAYYLLNGGLLIHLKPAAVSVAGYYRFISLLLFSIYLYVGFRTVQVSSLYRGISYIVALCLIAFWPLSLQMASRVNNDIAFYAASSIAFFSIVRWWQQLPGSIPFKPCIWVGLTATIKTNAIVLLAVVGFLFFIRILGNRITL